jgi:hypothetical protein
VSAFEPHLSILPPEQREVWPLLAPAASLGLVLYGGTAVALRLGHRQSVDFDFFTEKSLDPKEVEREFPFIAGSRLIQDQPNTLSVMAQMTQGTVKISFFGGISHGRVGVPDRTPDGVICIASILDLLATKLKVIQQRIESKDYRDIAAILDSGIRLEMGLGAAQALYGASFQPSEAVKALVCFEGGDLSSLGIRERQILISAAGSMRSVPALGVASRSLSA